jgi:hypothetical protein
VRERLEQLRERVASLRYGRAPEEPVVDPGIAPSELRERRERLAAQFAELQWDLGGLAYEMAARDHFRLEVLVRRAARLQEVDAELGEVERLLRLEDAGAAGACSSCGALHARGATFCWQCGADLLERRAVRTEPAA